MNIQLISTRLLLYAFAVCATTSNLHAQQSIDPPTSSAASNGSGELFEKHIRPALIEHCIRCHGPDKQKGGLRLDSAEGWATGGDSGPALLPGDGSSLLLEAIRYESGGYEMPPKGKLPKTTIEAFERWVALGAFDPRKIDSESEETHIAVEKTEAEILEQGKDFWAFQPLQPTQPPAIVDAAWPANDIDRFILDGLEREGLTPNPMADRMTLLRRVYVDLTGLPPTPEQIESFVNDPSDQAWSEVVDELLNSPHFGERWGRHWLDVVRYAESSGGGRTLLLPEAWRYRDYVIDSFNRDLPYDQFLIQQIAGDLLPWSDWRERQSNLIATGFLLLGPTNYELQDKDILEMDVVDEQLDTIGKAFLGMTIGCARCHDHKFDPIPATDYYAMAGIFKSTQSLIHSNVSSWNMMDLPVSEDEESRLATHQQLIQEAQQELKAATERWKQAGGDPAKKKTKASLDPKTIDGIVLDDSQAEIVGAWTESTFAPGYVGAHYIHDDSKDRGNKRVIFQPPIDQPGRYEVLVSYTPGANRSKRVPIHVHHRDGETVNQIDQQKRPPIENAFISLGIYSFDEDHAARVVVTNDGTSDGVVIADAVVIVKTDEPVSKIFRNQESTKASDKQLLKKLKTEMDDLQAKVKSLQKSGPSRPRAIAVQDRPESEDIPLAIRGVVAQKGPITPRGVMRIASWKPFPALSTSSSGRLEFANWVADPRNPLTARVLVNRIWYWMMGSGIVDTLDNFGSTGTTPRDARLLDYLASSFIEDGWSIKQLVRRIAMSHAYQMDSDPNRGTKTNADSKQPIDSSNRWHWRMNRKRLRAEAIRDSILMVAGSLENEVGGNTIKPGTSSEYGYEFDTFRRSVYLPVFRNALPEIFEVFDFADPNTQLGKRSSSTIASQALWMMNHPTIVAQSRMAAKRLLDRPISVPSDRIEYVYLQVLGRPPTQPEMEIALDLVASEDNHEFAQENEGTSSGDMKNPDSEEQNTGSVRIQHDDRVTRWAMLYQVLFQCIDFRYLN